MGSKAGSNAPTSAGGNCWLTLASMKSAIYDSSPGPISARFSWIFPNSIINPAPMLNLSVIFHEIVGCMLNALQRNILYQMCAAPVILADELQVPACHKKGRSVIVRASVPKPLLNHSLVAASVVAEIMYQKYVNAMPLYRQEAAWKQLGVTFSRTTMARWIIRCAEDWLEPLWNAMRKSFCKEKFCMQMRRWCRFSKRTARLPSPSLTCGLPYRHGWAAAHCIVRLPARTQRRISKEVSGGVLWIPAYRRLCRLQPGAGYYPLRLLGPSAPEVRGGHACCIQQPQRSAHTGTGWPGLL